MTPAMGEALVVPTGLPRTIDSAITRYGSASFKAPVATVLDPNGKLTTTLTYGKNLMTLSLRVYVCYKVRLVRFRFTKSVFLSKVSC